MPNGLPSGLAGAAGAAGLAGAAGAPERRGQPERRSGGGSRSGRIGRGSRTGRNGRHDRLLRFHVLGHGAGFTAGFSAGFSPVSRPASLPASRQPFPPAAWQPAALLSEPAGLQRASPAAFPATAASSKGDRPAASLPDPAPPFPAARPSVRPAQTLAARASAPSTAARRARNKLWPQHGPQQGRSQHGAQQGRTQHGAQQGAQHLDTQPQRAAATAKQAVKAARRSYIGRDKRGRKQSRGHQSQSSSHVKGPPVRKRKKTVRSLSANRPRNEKCGLSSLRDARSPPSYPFFPGYAIISISKIYPLTGRNYLVPARPATISLQARQSKR